jgi:hypothetical protein
VLIPELGIEYPDDHADIAQQARDELCDLEYLPFPHGTRATFAKGCRGPMCRKANRDYLRAWQRANYGQPEIGRSRVTAVRQFDPFLEAYTRYSQDKLAQLIAEGLQPPKRRDSGTRISRTAKPIPAATLQILHRRRPALGGSK